MKALIPWLVTATALAVGGYVALDRRVDRPAMTGRPGGGHATDLPSADATTRSEMDMLRRDVTLLKAELAASRAASVAATRDTQTASPAATQSTQTDSMDGAEQELQFEHHLAETGARFAKEGLDQRWANEIGIALEGVLASEDLQALAVRNIDCRTKTCRIEVEDDGSGTMPAALPFLAMGMADALPNVVSQRVDQPNGRATVILYMSRE